MDADTVSAFPSVALDSVLGLSILLKSAVIGALLFLAACQALLVRTISGRIGAVFSVVVANYLVCTVVQERASFFPANLLYIGCAAVPYVLWLYVRSLFEDGFRLNALYLIGGLVFVAWQWSIGWIANAYQASAPAAAILLPLASRLAPLVFTLLAFLYVVRGWTADLVETRRRFRSLFAFAAGGYALLVTIVEIALRGESAPALVELLNALGIGGAVGFLGLQFVGQRFGAIAVSAPRKSAPADAVDPEVMRRLDELMEKEIWKEDGLTIRLLADRLLIPEYRLRRAINGALGFRNFNDYLNRYRIRAACRALTDPAQRAMPVLRIALDMGFGSLAPFNRAFRSLTGLTPTAYRENPGAARRIDLPADGER